MQPQIDELKARYGLLYVTEIADATFVWRPLSRPEWDIVTRGVASKDELDERICQMSVVWPEGIDFSGTNAGWPSGLAPQIREVSGFGSPDVSADMLEAYRQEINNDWEAQAEVTIKAAFPDDPDITFDKMKDWPMEKLLQHLARAEWKLRNIDGRPISFEIRRPEEEGEKPTPQEIAAQLRENGIDPMLTIDPETLKKPYLDGIMIAGTKWHSEVVWNELQQQISRLPKR